MVAEFDVPTYNVVRFTYIIMAFSVAILRERRFRAVNI